MPNRLAAESSPYLTQHADNPVDWYPWGEEALARARKEDRPILLSIGYSSCHWCHVMERESFEDPEVAALMNKLFVSIKVDREERPDIDQIYMKAVQAMTGGGGWPMTVFLTPEGVPFYGGTYFPPVPRHGLPSFAQVLTAAAEAYRKRGDKVRDSGAHLISALAAARAGSRDGRAGVEALDAAYRTLANQYDGVHGGFGRAPKFPQPVTLELLLRHHLRTRDPTPLDMVVHTLRRMAAGGLRDHLGGGFHRYSVDARWLVPHFEKMLYDNALLARVYLLAHLVTGHADLRAVAIQTLDYLSTDMRSPDGGFYSARDADSEGEEGLFYLWTPEDLSELLDREDARLLGRLYDVSPGGNFEGRSILHLPHEPDVVAGAEGMKPDELDARMAGARAILLAARDRRTPPFRDEKVLLAWNAMAVRAFAEAGAALGRPDYSRLASETADFLWHALQADGRLLHTYMNGEAKIPAFLDDYAALGNALLSLHAATLRAGWLDLAHGLCERVMELFWDEEAGTVFDAASDGESLVLRPRDPMDNATPSGPSLAAELLARAGHIWDEDRYREASKKIIDHESEALVRFGPAFGRMLSVLDRTLAPPVEIAIIGRDGDPATAALVRAAHADVLRNKCVVGRLEGDTAVEIPLLEGLDPSGKEAAAYVCRGYACQLPTTDPDQLRRQVTITPAE